MILALRNQIRRIPKPVIEAFWLLIVLLVPLVIVLGYDCYKLKTNSGEEIRNGVEHAYKHLQARKANNLKQLQAFNRKIQEDFKLTKANLEEAKSIIQTITQSSMTRQKINNYYESNHIINVQIASGFISQAGKIREEIMNQLSWINQSFGMKLKITEWRQGMNLNDIRSGLIVVFREMKTEFIDQNIALKLKKGDYRSPYYLKQIVKQLKGLPSFSHCKFTNRECMQSSIVFVKHNEMRQASFWEVDGQMYFLDEINQEIIFNILSSIMEVNHYVQLYGLTKSAQISSKLYRTMKQRSQMQEFDSILAYLNHTIQETHFNMKVFEDKLNRNVQQAIRYIQNGQFVSPYIHTTQQTRKINELLNGIAIDDSSHTIILQNSILDDDQIGIIDTFPNDFKIGVYLPLLVIFLYPSILKLKQLILYIFNLLRKRPKESNPKKND